jgi:hypothetical protein
MRRRHRHFNPAHAGAAIVLDSRYGFSQADNTAVSSWEDRSGNNNDATQATAAAQPTYETNEVGGQPAVRFDGSNFLTASAVSAPTASSIIATCRPSTTSGNDRNAFYYGNSSNFSPNFNWVGVGKNFSTAKWISGNYNNPTEASVVSSANYTTNATIAAGITNDASTNRLFLNGADEGTASSTTVSINAAALPTLGRRGGLAGGYYAGDIFNLSWFLSAITASVRRRVEHAAAYAFKISCN